MIVSVFFPSSPIPLKVSETELRSGEGPGVGTDRQRLRDEIDALVAHLYGLSRAEFEHILRTFPLVFPSTPEGEAKLAGLLAVYDAMAGAAGG